MTNFGGVLEHGGYAVFIKMYNELLNPVKVQLEQAELDDPDNAELDKVVEELNKRFRDRYKLQPIINITSREERIKHSAFLSTVAGFDGLFEYDGDNLSSIETRILNSDYLLLYYLIIGNGIEKIYEDWRSSKEDRSDKDEDQSELYDEKRIKAELADRMIRANHAKNLELELAERNKGLPTIGFEFEYIDSFKYLREKKIEISSKIKVMESGDGSSDEENNKHKKELADLRRTLKTIEEIIGNISEDQFKKISQSDNYSGDRDNYCRIKSYQFDVLTALEILPLKAEIEKAGERVSKPSISPRVQLRDFIHARLSGALTGPIGIHETIGGIDLAPDRTDYMDVVAILSACGYMNDPSKSDEEVRKLTFERCRKESYFSENIEREIEGGYYYFPYHKSRPRDLRMNRYPNELQESEGLEIRIFGVNDLTFANFVRSVTFSWLAACGEKAAWKEPEDRTTQEQQLAQAWEKMLEKWKSHLERWQIHRPSPKERCIKYEDNIEYNEKTVPFSTYLARLRYGSRKVPKFKEESHKILREYSLEVKKIVRY